MIDGTSSARITVASKMIPAARPIPNCLMSTPGPVESTKNANMSTSAALVTSLPVRARPSAIACLRVAGLVVGLTHARDHEHLVVHRQAVEEREDHQRDPGDDRVGRVHVPDRLRAVPLLEDEDDDPERGAERDQVQDHRLDRQERPSGTPASAGRTSAGSRTRARRGTSRTRRGRSPGPRGPSAEADARAAAELRLERGQHVFCSCAIVRFVESQRRPPTGTPRRAGSCRASRRAGRQRRRPHPSARGGRQSQRRPRATVALDQHDERLEHTWRDAGSVKRRSPITASCVFAPASAFAWASAAFSCTPGSSAARRS